MRSEFTADTDALAESLVRCALAVQAGARSGAALRADLIASVSDVLGRTEASTAPIVDEAMSHELGVALTPDEEAAFRRGFGSEAASQLSGWVADASQLEEFRTLWGASGALALLDVLIEMHAGSGGVSVLASATLYAHARTLGVDALVVAERIATVNRRAAPRALPLLGDRVRIGRSPGSDVSLPDPQVAPLQAELIRGDNGWRVREGASGRPIRLDGVAVTSAPLTAGQTLGLGPYSVALDEGGKQLIVPAPAARQALHVDKISRRIGPITLLDDVSFTAYTGEVIAVVGASGAGKSTLLNAISGVAPPDEGQISLGGRPLHAMLRANPATLGIVPQDDLVHPELTVEESLNYAARLRLAADVKPDYLAGRVDWAIRYLGLEGIRDSRIGSPVKRGISGGQRKRVNLSHELLSQSTKLLMLDEPTSGLDPQSSHDIARLARQLADDGRLVFFVTHDLTPTVLSQVDHLLVIAPGGRLIFFGAPPEAAGFFGVDSPDQLFGQLDQRSTEEWLEGWSSSETCAIRLESRAAAVQPQANDRVPEATVERAPKRSFLRELVTQTRRYALIKARDVGGAMVLFAQPLFLGLVIGIVFPEPTPGAIFMITLSCLWFGMSSSVRELIADRAVWQRERRVGARRLPYLLSRLLVLGFVVGLQCAAMTLFLYNVFGLQGAEYGYGMGALVGVQLLTGLAGMALGLFVSAVMSSSEAAVGMLPLLLVPQIAFSSIMVGLRWMEPLAKACTWITVQRYAFDAALKTGEGLRVPSRVPGQWSERPLNGVLYELGLKSSSVDDMGLSLAALCWALVAWAVGFFIATWAVTALRDRNA